ncbi:hypothetical protein BX666DRAFT_2029002 [Dichotomocladium elegans]|nr:hypothetical protein BX666DRAFT_2029002 [Dichotomocladium elegans]
MGSYAGLFCPAQGVVMMAYPEEKDRRKCISIFWSRFNMGGILGLNLSGGGSRLSTFVYVVVFGGLWFLRLAPASMVYLYQVMGTMSNNPTCLTRYAGFYKALRSAGVVIAFTIDVANIRLCWGCLLSWACYGTFIPGGFVCRMFCYAGKQ